jgi:hypothetical protein
MRELRDVLMEAIFSDDSGMPKPNISDGAMSQYERRRMFFEVRSAMAEWLMDSSKCRVN